MAEDKEPLSTRVVRIVHQAQPRWLSAKAVTEACPDDRSDLVYSTLNNYSQGKGPLLKRRGVGGVVEYTTGDQFDLVDWLEQRAARRRRPMEGDSLEICVRIVQTLRQYPDQRLTSSELESTKRFNDQHSLVRNLALLCDETEPLARDRRQGAETGSPFEYWIKPGFDVDTWLKERGAGTSPLALGEVPAIAKTPAAPAAPAAQSAARTAVPTKPAEQPTKPAATEAPASDGVRAGARVVQGRDMRDDQPPKPLIARAPVPESKAPPAAAAAAVTNAGAEPPVSSPKARAKPSNPAEPVASSDLSTCLVIVAAACLASAVREHVNGIDQCSELARALANFETADRAYLREHRAQFSPAEERAA